MTPRERLRTELHEHGFASVATLHELGLLPADVLDLAVAAHSAAAPPRALQAITGAPLRNHEDPSGRAAREALAAMLGTSPEQLVLGHGAPELTWACGRAFARSGAAVLSVMPAETQLARGARAAGARTLQWRAVERRGHAVDLEQVAELIQLESPALIGLGTPAAISGSPVCVASVLELARRFPASLFVVDQSELALSDQHVEAQLAPSENVLFVRSVDHELGLPGLCAGYVWGQAARCAALAAQRANAALGSTTLAAFSAVSREREFVASCRLQLRADRARLERVLAELGLAATPSVGPALLVRIARAAEVAEELLLEHRIAVRDCTGYGLPDHLRIAALAEAHETRLRDALAQVLARRKLRGGRET